MDKCHQILVLVYISDNTNETWCYCGQGKSYDKTIACEYLGCEIEWFHFSCVGLTEDLIKQCSNYKIQHYRVNIECYIVFYNAHAYGV